MRNFSQWESEEVSRWPVYVLVGSIVGSVVILWLIGRRKVRWLP